MDKPRGGLDLCKYFSRWSEKIMEVQKPSFKQKVRQVYSHLEIWYDSSSYEFLQARP